MDDRSITEGALALTSAAALEAAMETLHARREDGSLKSEPVRFGEIDPALIQAREALDLEQGRFAGTAFEGLTLGPWATFRAARFDGCVFRDCVLYGALFRGARFRRCLLERVTFIGVSMMNARLEECAAHEVTFSHGDLRLLRLDRCALQDCRLILLVARELDWRDTSIVSSTLFDSSFDGGRLERCQFERTRLVRMGFQGARFVGSRFDACEIIDTTLPEGRGLTPADLASSVMTNWSGFEPPDELEEGTADA